MMDVELIEQVKGSESSDSSINSDEVSYYITCITTQVFY